MLMYLNSKYLETFINKLINNNIYKQTPRGGEVVSSSTVGGDT